MVAFLLFALGQQGDIGLELEQALAGKKLSGPGFHQAIDPVLDKYGALQTARFQRTAGDKRGLIVTLAGSGPNWDSTKAWRVFLWPENTKIRAQVIKRFGDYSTSAIDSYTDGEIFWRGDRLVIAGKDIDGTKTSRAGLTTYQLEEARWKLGQHLTSERMGVAAFSRLARSIDPSRVIVRTRLRPDHFRVSTDGPMLTFKETWLLKGSSYVKGSVQQEDTAVAFLDKIVGLAVKNDRKNFNLLVPTGYRDVLWRNFVRQKLMVESDGQDGESETFRLVDTPFIVGIAQISGKWTVSELLQT